MQLVGGDILADMCGLSVGPLAGGLGAGLFLWLFGWWSHRFWIVLVTTVLAGLCGLEHGPRLNTNPLLFGLLLALAAGLLALAAARLLAFAAGGLGGFIAVQNLLPSVDQPVIVFLACGLLGLLLFRPCLMALTSFAGTLLMLHCGLALANSTSSFNPISWSDEQWVLLNWVCGVVAFLGLLIQFLMDRGRWRRHKHGGGVASLLSFGWGARSYRKAG
jgi:hypothetical protein